VIVNLVDSGNINFDIPAEDVRTVPNCNFAQVTFRLPTSALAGLATVKVKARMMVSNSAVIRIGP